MPDRFDALHELLKKDRSAALEQLLDPASCSIKEPYAEDLNHAWYMVGDIYFKQGEFSLALESFLKASLKQSESAALFYNLGNALFDQGKFGEALCYFKRVAVTDSEIYAMAQRNLERCHAMRRDR